MVAMSMPNKNLEFLTKLSADYPDLIFRHGKKFTFRPPNTIILGQPCPNYALLTLHELGHAVLKHKDYKLDVERLKIEAAAWKEAKSLSKKYHIKWDKDFAEDQLDTYRDWLHQKSLCKTCQLTRYQSSSGVYHCPGCSK